jgi:type II restriction/modification system DNA methylase subunit YeeA
MLDGEAVSGINANLTTGVDTTKAQRLEENAKLAFVADVKGGSFDITEEVARRMLAQANPDGRRNEEVVRPWVNGLDVTRRPRGRWIIDFGVGMPEGEAALYEAPFEHVVEHVKPARVQVRRKAYATKWWLHVEPCAGMRGALTGLSRYIGTPSLTKHRLFVWLSPETLADHQLIVFARDDDYFFGVLHSRVHETWARCMGTQLREVESGFRYTPTSTFETFPFPRPSDEEREEIAEAARVLNQLREGWLNPSGASEEDLKKRTLTNLYNKPPAWLKQAHERLDRAVYAAYGWECPLEDQTLLARLLELNRERAEAEQASTQLAR